MRNSTVSVAVSVIVVCAAGVSLIVAIVVVPPTMCLASLWVIGGLILAAAGAVALVKGAVSWIRGTRPD